MLTLAQLQAIAESAQQRLRVAADEPAVTIARGAQKNRRPSAPVSGVPAANLVGVAPMVTAEVRNVSSVPVSPSDRFSVGYQDYRMKQMFEDEKRAYEAANGRPWGPTAADLVGSGDDDYIRKKVDEVRSGAPSIDYLRRLEDKPASPLRIFETSVRRRWSAYEKVLKLPGFSDIFTHPATSYPAFGTRLLNAIGLCNIHNAAKAIEENEPLPPAFPLWFAVRANVKGWWDRTSPEARAFFLNDPSEAEKLKSLEII